MPYWDHEEETQFLASPLCDSYNKGKMPGLSLRWTGLFSFMCPPPPDCLKSLGESRKVCTPLQGDNGFSILTGGTFTFKTVSPTTSVCKGIFRVHLRCLPAKVYSVRISGVCLQGYFQGASQVFACKGVFGAHLRCLQLTETVIGPVSAYGTLNRSLPDVITPPKGHPSILYGHQTALTVPANCKR